MYKGRFVVVLSLVTCFNLSSSYAAKLSGVDLSGFLTTAITQTDNEKETPYLNGLATDELGLSNRENRIGIQIKAPIADDMKITALFIARGGNSNYNFTTDWAYLDYNLSDNFSMHLGKYKIPQFLVSDYADVGYAYPWVRPPQDVYTINPLISLSGVQLFYRMPFGKNSMLFQLFYGTGTHDVFIPARSLDAIRDNLSNIGIDPAFVPPNDLQQTVTTKKTRGANIAFTMNTLTFRVGYFETLLDADFKITKISDAAGSFSSIGLSFDWHNIVLYTEAVSRDTEVEKVKAFPDQKAWYSTFGYRFGPFLPSITYSEIREGETPDEVSVKQKSKAIGLRVELNKAATLKFEALEATPESGNHGLFDTPVESGKVYTITFDAVF